MNLSAEQRSALRKAIVSHDGWASYKKARGDMSISSYSKDEILSAARALGIDIESAIKGETSTSETERKPGSTLNECRMMAERSAQEGSKYGIYALSCILEPDAGKENAKTDQALSNKMLMSAFEKGHPCALSKVALASSHGWRGLPKDESLAHGLYRQAAQGGEIGSFLNCGILESESGNHDAAIWWLERAVKTGNLYAKSNLKQVRQAAETRKRQKM